MKLKGAKREAENAVIAAPETYAQSRERTNEFGARGRRGSDYTGAQGAGRWLAGRPWRGWW